MAAKKSSAKKSAPDPAPLPGTLERSPAKVQRTYSKTLESAEAEYGDEARAHRTAWASVKNVAEDCEQLTAMGAFEQGDPYLWTREYGSFGTVHLVRPPGEPSSWTLDTYPGADPDIIGVEIGMWTREEGRSDLSLSLQLAREGGRWLTKFGDLHVL